MVKNNINIIIQENRCTGCASCVYECPQHIISIEENNRGFLSASIKDSCKCIHCGKCLQKCPSEHRRLIPESACDLKKSESFFYGYAKDAETREKGTSGGIVSALSNYFVQQGGVVYGAFLDLISGDVKHISSEDVPLSELAKTKYCQSNHTIAFENIIDKLKSGRLVFYCGTPCQVYGLKSCLQELGVYDTKNLFTVDFICHGVPSRKIFREYYAALKSKMGGHISVYEFRSKIYGWPRHIVLAKGDGRKYIKKATLDKFQFLFQEDLSLNGACLTCPFREKHDADITVGDFWGYSKVDGLSNFDKGLSFMVANNTKGMDALRHCEMSQFIALQNDTTDYRYKILKKCEADEDKIRRNGEFFDFYLSKGYSATLRKYASVFVVLRNKLEYIMNKNKR